MNITIVGGGNIGTQFAVHCAVAKHEVTIYSSHPEKFQKHLIIVNSNREIILEGDIKEATSDPKTAFISADVIFVTIPASGMENIAMKILPFAHSGMKIGIIPGTGGGECAFQKFLEKGVVIFGLQRVPSVARLIEYGRCVCATGYRDKLFSAALPHMYCLDCCSIISDIFDIPCSNLPNYLNLTMTPSNPILHTTRLYTLFKRYELSKHYSAVPLFYEDWDNETSVLLLKCDDEVQKICNALIEFNLSYVKSLRIHYESDTPEKLTKKLASIAGFRGIKVPMISVNNGFIPDFNSRYFTADFPYGISILVQIAEFVGVDTPNMKLVWQWYREITVDNESFSYAHYGIRNIETLKEFYKR
ncbi:NAD/NADP octopine/nopaline dehydrogenase family protein [Hungatella hathewayi]|uniref:NAD/NADP-dependent octopine/nopaline dehydrogenase family protein n=1 Tax=Hungatella hathewayi TaxID=154046 RepID=UPI00210CBF32|nr:NAD/NADP-dependent octopine/nopaline dehydrogenase family protein [Hungatella hathewayi]MCQ5386543.1 NAD/NADP octopine/nopaline dehydrogenase family protein [Hungatella hathewayi]